MDTNTKDKETQIGEALDAIIRRLIETRDRRAANGMTPEGFYSALDNERQELMNLELLADPEPDISEWFRSEANTIGRDGETEVDDNAVVSMGDDPGAYVMAWVWVDCKCPNCDDKRANIEGGELKPCDECKALCPAETAA